MPTTEQTYLEDVGPCARNTASNTLDEPGDLCHDIDTVQPFAERAIQLRMEILRIRRLAIPDPFDGCGLGPLTFLILGGFNVGCRVVDACVYDLIILHNSTNVDDRRTVRGWCGEFHHDGGIGRGLEVDKVPASRYVWSTQGLLEWILVRILTSVMGLHALDRMDEHTPTLEVKRLFLGLDGSFHTAARPECMMHRTPGVLGVCAKVGSAILTDDEARGTPREGQVHKAVLVDSRFNSIGIAFFVESDGQIVRTKGKHAFIEHEVAQGIRVPIVGRFAVHVVDLRIKLSGGMDAPAIEREESAIRNSVDRKKVISPLTRCCCR